MRVCVLAGGRSSEHDVSRASAAAVSEGLRAGGHEVVAVDCERDGSWRHDGRALAVEPGGGLLGADVVFPVLHGPFGEDGTVQGLLEIADVAYVGAGVLASALCMDKVTFKELMARAGVPQVKYAAVREGGGIEAVARLGLPVFVKPARLGSSVGISKVSGAHELRRAIEDAHRHDALVIAEAMAHGTEVECSVIGNGQPEASQPGEIVIESEWYDYEAKYTPGGMELVVPARIPTETAQRVRELAVQVFLLVDCAGLARVDFFVTDDGEVLVNELNTMPGFTETSVFAKLFEASGVPYPELCDRLVALALERHAERRKHAF
ncbi:MAG: D-alanine--D-alanine ligase family protein [Thermoleophilaceae bacterium]